MHTENSAFQILAFFSAIVYDICASLSIDYLAFRFWVSKNQLFLALALNSAVFFRQVHAWTTAILMIMVVTDASALVSYITRFTEESFATLIAVIFIYEALVKVSDRNSKLRSISKHTRFFSFTK